MCPFCFFVYWPFWVGLFVLYALLWCLAVFGVEWAMAYKDLVHTKMKKVWNRIRGRSD
ncbi:MAG: hypothetical protein ACXACW_16440 [Candidatus Hodarchaeales archaeon]|jgi:hypothetical protein